MFLVLAAAALSAQIDCSSIKDNEERLACYDTPTKGFGVVSGQIIAISASSRPSALPTRIVLVPFPLSEVSRSTFQAEGLSDLGIVYSQIPGLMKGDASLHGEFRISHVPEGKYLAIVFSNAFSMRPSGFGCAEWTDGALAPEAKPSNMSTCKLVEVHAGEETSMFETLRGSTY